MHEFNWQTGPTPSLRNLIKGKELNNNDNIKRITSQNTKGIHVNQQGVIFQRQIVLYLENLDFKKEKISK